MNLPIIVDIIDKIAKKSELRMIVFGLLRKKCARYSMAPERRTLASNSQSNASTFTVAPKTESTCEAGAPSAPLSCVLFALVGADKYTQFKAK